MSGLRTATWWAGGLCVAAVALTGCNSDESGTAEPMPSSAIELPSDAARPPSQESTKAQPPLTTPSPAANPDRCLVSELTVTLGQESGAAGSVGFPIVFTNTSQRQCVLDGFPGVSYAHGPGSEPIGAPAARQGSSSGPVRLAPGEKASATVQAVNVSNYPQDRCAPAKAPGLRIYPPNDVDSLYVAHEGTACTLATPDTSAQLKVGPVVAGAVG